MATKELIDARGWVLGLDSEEPHDKTEALRLVLCDLLKEISELREQLYEADIVERDES